MWWNSTRKGFYLRNYRWSASSGLFETLPVDLYCENSLCTSVNCQINGPRISTSTQKWTATSSTSLPLVFVRDRRTFLPFVTKSEVLSARIVRLSTKMYCLNIHTDGKCILWPTVLNLNRKNVPPLLRDVISVLIEHPECITVPYVMNNSLNRRQRVLYHCLFQTIVLSRFKTITICFISACVHPAY